MDKEMSEPGVVAATAEPRWVMPAWASELALFYESGAANQFILHGNVDDRFPIPTADSGLAPGTLSDFLQKVLMPRFDVILTYDLGAGLRIDLGGQVVQQWPRMRELPELPRAPRAAMEVLTAYFRYCVNLQALGKPPLSVGCIVRHAELVAPPAPGPNYDLGALALLMREWASDSGMARLPLATFIIAEDLSELHPVIISNPRAHRVRVPLPSPAEIAAFLGLLSPGHAKAMAQYADRVVELGERLAGLSLNAVERLVKTRQQQGTPIVDADLGRIRREMVEGDSGGLIDFVESDRTLSDLAGQDGVKAWLRQDIELWHRGAVEAVPKGYLICGPVGTGKTFMVECLAGEAGVPMVKLKNFRDKWVGSTEANLERVFRLIRALGRCYVFIDEADQALGRRDSGTGDSGLSGRVYSMVAEEMGRSDSRGKVVWILATSRPDLVEVDLKRPGRVDVKIPLFPTVTAEESFALLQKLLSRRRLALPESSCAELLPLLPTLLTPGAAEAVAVKVHRTLLSCAVGSEPPSVARALADCLHGYQPPVPVDVIEFQVGLAVREASDAQFVPEALRRMTRT